jgi:hypothetical protein
MQVIASSGANHDLSFLNEPSDESDFFTRHSSSTLFEESNQCSRPAIFRITHKKSSPVLRPESHDPATNTRIERKETTKRVAAQRPAGR